MLALIIVHTLWVNCWNLAFWSLDLFLYITFFLLFMHACCVLMGERERDGEMVIFQKVILDKV